MAQVKTTPQKFNIGSPYHCRTLIYTSYTDASHENVEHQWTELTSAHAWPTTNYVTFKYELPEGAIVKSAKVHAKLGSSTYGAVTSTINGVWADPNSEALVDVTLTEGATSIVVPFVFTSKSPAHDHTFDGGLGNEFWETDTLCRWTKTVDHEGVLSYSDVYLLIEYTPPFTPPTLNPYTDPRLYVGETYVKAVHMTELHTNANLVRMAYHLPAYAFPPIVARESLLARWNEDVIELRVALDEIGVGHEEWLVLDFNRPRLDVLLQLRRVVAALARGGEQEETDGAQLYTADGALLMDANGLYFKAWEGN